MSSSPISVIVHTLNEEKNIRNCLECVKWADEIIIVDMFSEDLTVPIAREYTDRIFMFKRCGYADPARKYALQQVSNDWVLVVDADELVTMPLRDRLLEIAKVDDYDAVLIPHHNYFFGKEMLGTGWGPLQDKHIRFFKKSVMQYGERIHSFSSLASGARVVTLNDPKYGFIHFNYIDVEHFVDKFNRYTTIEAKNAQEAGERFSASRTVYKALKEFGNRYILKKGYKDGFQGFSLAMLMVAYQVTANLKLSLIKKCGTEDIRSVVEKQYAAIAAQVIESYKK